MLPIDFSEVTISRTLFRTGESEYAINRVPCRLLDIQELLSDTGVGRQQHVIVSQGNLDAILNSRPEERRLVIEEAAGVLKFRRRKERAERRLESTEASLVRLQDLQREVRRQLRPLEKQADAARRHGDLVAELASVRRYLLGRELGASRPGWRPPAVNGRSSARVEGELRPGPGRSWTPTSWPRRRSPRRPDRGAEPAVDLAETVSRAEATKARAAAWWPCSAERHRSLARALTATVDHDVIAALEAETAALHERLTSVGRGGQSACVPLVDELAAAEAELTRRAARTRRGVGGRGSGRRSISAAGVRGELAALRSSLDQSGEEARRLGARMISIERAGGPAHRRACSASRGSSPRPRP